MPRTGASAGSGRRTPPPSPNLGRMYVEDARFKANYDRIADGLAEFYRDAMACYADTVLSWPAARSEQPYP